MDTRGEITQNLNSILVDVDEIFNLLRRPVGEGRSRQQVIDNITDIETRCRLLKHALIRAARAQGHGIRQNGEPDLRYNQNRELPTPEKKTARKTQPKPGQTKQGGPDLRYGKSAVRGVRKKMEQS
jgi:hypothetical protein